MRLEQKELWPPDSNLAFKTQMRPAQCFDFELPAMPGLNQKMISHL